MESMAVRWDSDNKGSLTVIMFTGSWGGGSKPGKETKVGWLGGGKCTKTSGKHTCTHHNSIGPKYIHQEEEKETLQK